MLLPPTERLRVVPVIEMGERRAAGMPLRRRAAGGQPWRRRPHRRAAAAAPHAWLRDAARAWLAALPARPGSCAVPLAARPAPARCAGGQRRSACRAGWACRLRGAGARIAAGRDRSRRAHFSDAARRVQAAPAAAAPPAQFRTAAAAADHRTRADALAPPRPALERGRHSPCRACSGSIPSCACCARAWAGRRNSAATAMCCACRPQGERKAYAAALVAQLKLQQCPSGMALAFGASGGTDPGRAHRPDSHTDGSPAAPGRAAPHSAAWRRWYAPTWRCSRRSAGSVAGVPEGHAQLLAHAWPSWLPRHRRRSIARSWSMPPAAPPWSAKAAATSASRPASTFKIAISLMGFDSGVLRDEHTPYLPYKAGYAAWQSVLAPRHRSGRLAARIGRLVFGASDGRGWAPHAVRSYVQAFDYGNRGLASVPGVDDAIALSEVSPTLKITPIEQTVFLRKLVNRSLPLSAHAYDMTARLLKAETLAERLGSLRQDGHGATRLADGSATDAYRLVRGLGHQRRPHAGVRAAAATAGAQRRLLRRPADPRRVPGRTGAEHALIQHHHHEKEICALVTPAVHHAYRPGSRPGGLNAHDPDPNAKAVSQCRTWEPFRCLTPFDARIQSRWSARLLMSRLVRWKLRPFQTPGRVHQRRHRRQHIPARPVPGCGTRIAHQNRYVVKTADDHRRRHRLRDHAGVVV